MARDETNDADGPTAEVVAVAGLIEDDCARQILVASREEAMSAAELAAACEVSEQTVYRRLEDLTGQGLVEESVRLDRAGHHENTYRAVLDRVTFDVEDDGVTVSIERAESMSERFTRYVQQM